MIRSTGGDAMGSNAAVVRTPFLRLRCVLISCGIFSILVAAALLAVTLTVYRVREPVMTMNAISLKDPGAAAAAASSSASSTTPTPLLTSVYYRARQVGEALGPPGTAPARRTVRMNVTVDVAVGALLGDPAFLEDVVAAGAVAVATATRVRGRVAVLGGLVHRRVVLEMNCTAMVAVADMSISDQRCLQHVWLR